MMHPEHSRLADERVTVLPWTAFGLLVAGALVALYGVQGNAEEVATLGHSAIRWMVWRWSGLGGDLSHGWIIPLVSAYAVWRRRVDLMAASRRPCYAGLVLIALALLLHVVGVRAQLTRLSLLSMIGLVWALPLTCYGWGFARWLIFPAGYLLFCIPFSFLDSLTVPLRILASTASTVLLNGLGIAAVQSGTAVYTSAGGGFNFDVADACSGLRSLLAMTALTAAYARFTLPGFWRPWALFLCAVPLAIIGNVARIVAIGLVAQVLSHDWAMRVYHDYSSYIVFATAITLMMGVGRLLQPRSPAPAKGFRAGTGGDGAATEATP